MNPSEEGNKESARHSYKKGGDRSRQSRTPGSSSSQPVRFEYVEREDGSKKMVEVRRRRSRRTHQPKKIKEARKKILKNALIFGSIPLILIFGSIYMFMLSRINGQRFRLAVSENVSQTLGIDAEFGVFSLSGLNLSAREVELKSDVMGSLLREVRVDMPKTRIHPTTLISKNWHLGFVQAQSGNFFFGSKENVDLSALNHKASRTGQSSLMKAGIGLDSNPELIELKGIRISDCNLYWDVEDRRGDPFVEGSRANANDFSTASTAVNFRGGKLVLPHWPELNIDAVTGELRDGVYTVNNSKFSHMQRGRVILTGSVGIKGEGNYQISSDFTDLTVSDMVHPYWSDRISGELSGGLDITGSLIGDNSMNAVGSFTGINLELSNEPILIEISNELGEVSLRHLKFQSFEASFRKSGKSIEVFDISAKCLPLLRLGGNFSVLSDGSLEGQLMVGISEAVFKGQGSSKPVFFGEIEDGFAWAPFNVSGSIDGPKGKFTKLPIRPNSPVRGKATELLPDQGSVPPDRKPEKAKKKSLEEQFNEIIKP